MLYFFAVLLGVTGLCGSFAGRLEGGAGWVFFDSGVILARKIFELSEGFFMATLFDVEYFAGNRFARMRSLRFSKNTPTTIIITEIKKTKVILRKSHRFFICELIARFASMGLGSEGND